MSYLKKIEQDYNNGVISKTEIYNNRLKYNSLTKEEQNDLDIKYGSKNKLLIKKGGWIKYINDLNEQEVSYSEKEKLKTYYWTSPDDKRKELDDEPKPGVEKQLKLIRGFKTEETLLEMNLSFEERVLNILGKQQKLQERMSNNILFFFWITVISIFIIPLIWTLLGVSLFL